MIQVPVYNESGKQVGAESIDPALLGKDVNVRLLKQAVVMYQANARQGTVSQKTRGEVEGSTRKLYKQKGTGRARMGPVRQPVRRGGGRAFPRKPRDFRHDMPRKMRRLARDQAVLAKLNSEQVLILDAPRFETPKTKRFADMMKAVGAADGCVIATAGVDRPLYMSGRNVPRADVIDVAELNAVAVLNRPRLVFTREAFTRYRDELAGRKVGE